MRGGKGSVWGGCGEEMSTHDSRDVGEKIRGFHKDINEMGCNRRSWTRKERERD